MDPNDKQTTVFVSPTGEGSVMAMDSAYDVDERNTGKDVCVNSSKSGVLHFRFS